MYRRIGSLIGVALLAACASAYGAADDVTSIIRNADTCVSERNFDRARELYEQAQAGGARFETDLPHARNLAAVYLKSTPPDLAKAIKWLQVAVALDPQSDSQRAQLASALYRNGNFEAAIGQYRALAESHPTSTEYVIPLVTALRQAGKSDAALQFLQASAEKFPSMVAFRIEYARQLNFTKQFAEARKQFSAALGIAPQNLIAQVGLAKATSYEGDQESAIEMYNRILQRHPGLYDAIVGKAFSLLWAGQTMQAAALLRQASARNPDDSEVREALSTLPHSAGEPAPWPPSASPEEQSHRLDTPRRMSLRRAPNSENPESRAAPVLVQTIPPQQEQQHRPEIAIAIIGFCLTLASFAYGAIRARHLKLRSQTENRRRERTSDFPVSVSEIDPPRTSIALEAKPQPAAAVRARMETWEDDDVLSINVVEDCASARQPSIEDLVAPLLAQKPDSVVVEPEVHGDWRATHPKNTWHDRMEAGGISGHLNESHGLVEGHELSVAATRLQVLLVGGTSHEVELEKLWFPIATRKILWERTWAAAVRCLASTSPDLIVLNALSDDGRTSQEVFDWIITNRAELRDRTIVICSRADARKREDSRDVYLVEPFGASQWRQAVMAMLQSGEVGTSVAMSAGCPPSRSGNQRNWQPSDTVGDGGPVSIS